jgi:hypothetical protein
MANSDEIVVFDRNTREGLQRLGRTGFHVEELVVFWDFVKIRRMA